MLSAHSIAIPIAARMKKTSGGAAKQPLSCSIDNCTYTTISSNPEQCLRQHLASVHNIAKVPFECGVCHIHFAMKIKLKRHERKMHPELPHDPPGHKCDEPGCQYSTYTSSTLKSHLAFAHKKGTVIYDCDHAGCTFTAPIKLKVTQHKITVHKEQILLVRCEVSGCTFTARSKTRMREHVADVHNTTAAKRFACDNEECPFSASTNAKLRQHKITEHNDITLGFACLAKNCDYRTASVRTLNQHKIIKHKDSTVGIACEVENCEYRTTLSKSMAVHKIYSHKVQPEKWYVCTAPSEPPCEFKGKTASALLLHRGYVHKIIKNSHPCAIEGCGFKGVIMSHLKSHMSGKHNIEAKHLQQPVQSKNRGAAEAACLTYTELSASSSDGKAQGEGGGRPQDPGSERNQPTLTSVEQYLV